MKVKTPLHILKTIGATLLVSASIAHAKPLHIETVAQFSDTRPGNITVTPKGRIIITQQPLDGPKLRAVEILSDGSKVPFPNQDWSDGPETGKVGLAASIGIASDSKGVVWLLDMGSKETPAQIIAWDTIKNQLHKTIEIPASVTTPISFLQDFALDEKRGYIYIADMTFPAPGATPRPAFVVVNIKTGEARRILEGVDKLMPVSHKVKIGGSLVATKLESGKSASWQLGLNPIAIDPQFEWVYFGTVNGDEVFRIPASTLADKSLSEKSVIRQIKFYAKKAPSDGIAVDAKGRVFVSDVEASGVGIATPKGYNVIAKDKVRLSWPDGFAFGPDGYLYVTQNQLHLHPALNEGIDGSSKNYHIVKIKP